jgi:predicted PurR-regulated permease PerM
VLVGVVTLFTDFPTATIVWAIWAIVYAQIEGNILQPQIQRRALNVHPFTVLVAVLFGATLFGVLGAILAIPVAASIQIAAKEFLDYRQGELTLDDEGEPDEHPLDDVKKPADPPAEPAL